MLSLCLHARDAAGIWRPSPGGWSAGRSAILPYRHPALHACLLVSPRRTAVLVRERIAGEPRPGDFAVVPCGERELDRELVAVRSWPLDFLELLMIRRDGAAEVRLRCGSWGTAPVFLTARGGTLRAEWDVTRLYPHLGSARLEPGIAARYLSSLWHPYSRRTIFPDVAMLTERATALWRPPSAEVKVTYPPPEAHARAASLRPRARVAAAFREILTASMRRWFASTDDLAAVELSGGLDSSIVAATAAGVAARPVRSYGMIMPGARGGDQRARRREVVRRFGLMDRARPCLEHPPFDPRGSRVREGTAVPWGEFYEEAVGAMLDRVAADRARLIFTGKGGDELCSYQLGEVEEDSGEEGTDPGASPYPPFATPLLEDAYEAGDALLDEAPQALLETSALESVAAVAPIYLRRGVWPVSPLCTPELVEFCRRLPFAWRHRRTIERKVLASLGLSRAVTHARPERLETFDPVMERALRRVSSAAIAELFRDSHLAEQGLVDRDRLLATYARYRRGDLRHGNQILAAAVLELTIRSIEERRAARPRTTAPPT